MQIGTAAGFTYEIMVISHIDSTITRVLGVDTIHIGSHDGAFDTCVAIPNVGPLGLQLSEAIWSKGDGTFAMTFPKMPSHIAAGGSFRFCLYTVDARGNASTRLLLGGEMVDTFGIAHCVAHELVIDTKPPSDPVSSAPAPGTGGASMASITAYPNPFHAGLTVEIASPSRRHARVYAVDALGREVALLRDGMLDAGVTRLALDGAGLASGVYVIRCEMEGRMATRAVVVCR
jgi:hypothetical protein